MAKTSTLEKTVGSGQTLANVVARHILISRKGAKKLPQIPSITKSLPKVMRDYKG